MRCRIGGRTSAPVALAPVALAPLVSRNPFRVCAEMPPVHLKGQFCTGHGCFPPRPSAQGEPGFTVRGIPVHCQTHAWEPHGCAACAPHASVLAAGAPGMTVRGRQIGRIGDPVACGSRIAEGVADFTVGNGAPADPPAAHAALTRKLLAGSGGGANAVGASATDAADMDALLLCLPEIAAAEAKRAEDAGNANDAEGWDYLRQFLMKWFRRWIGPGDYETPQLTKREDRPASYVTWDWLLSYERVREAYDNLAANILNDAAKELLAERLREGGWLGDAPREFDFISAPERDWRRLHHQSRTVDGGLLSRLAAAVRIANSAPDGLAAALSAFTLYGLAAGRVKPTPGGGHEITVTRTAIFMRDQFDFVGGQPLGWWDCETKAFTFGGAEVTNRHFRAFRARHGHGGDFYVYARPRVIAGFRSVSFDLPLPPFGDSVEGRPYGP